MKLFYLVLMRKIGFGLGLAKRSRPRLQDYNNSARPKQRLSLQNQDKNKTHTASHVV
jgi:hypothetical protein